MQVEDFLDFREPNYIRLKGSRLSVENVLWDYLKQGDTAEQIHANYGAPLESIYAAILYYLADPEKVGKYAQDIWDAEEAAYQEYYNNPDAKTLELRQRFAALRAQKAVEAKKDDLALTAKPE